MRFWPKSLAGQLIAGILISLVVVQIMTFAIFIDERRGAVQAASRTQVLQRVASVVRLVEQSPPAMTEQITVHASDPWIRFAVATASAVGPTGTQQGDWRLRNSLERFLDREDVEVRFDIYEARGFPPLPFFGQRGGRNRDDPSRRWHRHDADDDEADDDDDDDWARYRRHGKHRIQGPIGMTISVQLINGKWLNTETVVSPARPAWAVPNITMAFGMAVVLVVVVIFLVRRATRPMTGLARAAEQLGRGEDVDTVAETGPSDVRNTIAAFNAMRERLERFVADRTRMLAAISHDLRTPLTSLRLRAEFIEDKDLQAKILRTLEEMQAMTEATLAFAREDAETEASRTVDLDSLVDSLCADLAETGLDVTCDANSGLSLNLRPASMRRALANLIQNAAAYGERARVTTAHTDTLARIVIEDDGPGIPEAERARVFEPFVRLEGSRNRETGGIGLGMAIARTLIHAHGGDVDLSDAAGGGLRVDVKLPLPQPTP